MMQTATKNKKKTSATKRIISVILFALAAILVVTSVIGFILRGTGSMQNKLSSMRTSAVLHAASGSIVDNIAAEASAAKLQELRRKPDFRSLGMDAVKNQCIEAEAAARAEAEALYSNTTNADTSALVDQIGSLEQSLVKYSALQAEEKQVYNRLYTDLYQAVPSWTEFTANRDDAALLSAIAEKIPDIQLPENAYLQPAMLQMAKDFSSLQQEREDEEQYGQLYSGLCGLVTDWTELGAAATDDELWIQLNTLMPDLSAGERFKDRLLTDIHTQITAAANGEVTEATVEEAVEAAEAEMVVDEKYLVPSEALTALGAEKDAKYQELWAELIKIIPDLDGLDSKMKASVQASIETIANSSTMSFDNRYELYSAQKANDVLTGNDAFQMQLAALATPILIGGIALILLALVYAFWTPLSSRLGIPRTIITLFFIYLCLAAELYNINVPFMLGNVLERVGMYGILVLAMLPGIQCGIGLNMGMTIGCIAGLLATMIALQNNMTGVEALTFSCVLGAIIAFPLGWAYSKLLNRMKGEEMTISTYVGFSFVSLMCIGWMLLPFNNPKIIWLLCGRGLRVTHGLLGSFAHILDNQLAFTLFGAKIPTGLLLFFLLCCGVMWLFARSKTGIAMTAAGSNPRFAEASGINVDHMRTIGTVLSTMIAAVGIVIYSQAFGYAQLYTAPRQLGFIAASAILIGGATVSKAKVGHVIIGVFLFEGVLALGQQIANSVVAGGGLSEVMRIMISNGIILYALTQSGGATRE